MEKSVIFWIVPLLAGLSCRNSGRIDIRMEPLKSGTTASLRGLCVVSSQVIWASGNGATFLRSLDGGDTWQAGKVEGAGSVDFRDVQAWDDNTALLMGVGSPALFYRTRDGGKSWTLVYRNDREGVFFDGMAFWDRKRGLAFSDPVDGSFLIVKTEDGGRTWREIDTAVLPAALAGEAGFAASGSSICTADSGYAWIGSGGGAARVFYSRDWGETWLVSATPLRSGAGSQGIFSLAFMNRNSGIAVGGDYQQDQDAQGTAAFSKDGGVTWKPSRIYPAGFRSAVALIPEWRGPVFLAVGTSGISLSQDGGRTWREIASNGFHAVSFEPSGKTGWACGAGGRIARLRPREVTH